MRLARTAALAAALCLAPLATGAVVLAERNGIRIEDGIVAASGAAARSAAAYMTITNTGTAADLLVGASSGAAARTMLHLTEVSDGVARMRHLADGIPLPPGGSVTLEPGGLHVMLMGLTAPLADGSSTEMTLVFEQAGEIPVSLPVRLGGFAGATPVPEMEH
jgi:periplasmic copper chaperone A